MDNKGQTHSGIGIGLIYGLVSAFGLTIAYLIVQLVFRRFLVPIFTDFITSSTIPLAVQTTVLSAYDKILFFLETGMVVIIAVLIVWLFSLTIRKERESQYV